MGGATRVLVADPVRDSADVLAWLLARDGMETRSVYDGEEAVAVARRWVPDGCVMDVALPGQSGFDVARELRRMYGSGIRLVAYTAWSGIAHQKRAIDAGFDDYLVKPATPEQLFTSLGHETALLLKRSAAAQLEQIKRQIALSHSLLNHAEAWQDSSPNICEFLSRALEVCSLGVAAIPLETSDRRIVVDSLTRLQARIARVRGAGGTGSATRH